MVEPQQEQLNNPGQEEEEEEEELSSDEEEAGYAEMPNNASAKDQNLYEQLTADLNRGLMKQKQAEFDTLSDRIDRVFQGEIGNFYAEDFPSQNASESERASAELQAALGDAVQVQEVAVSEILSEQLAETNLNEQQQPLTGRRQQCQRKLIAVNAIMGADVRQPIMECDPIVTVVDMFGMAKYCSWCFKQNNPRPPEGEDPSDPDSFVPFVTLRSCSGCQFAQYCSQDCQRAHWPDHKPECSGPLLKIMPTSLRLLLQVMRLKTDTKRKNQMENLKIFNQKVLSMVSMAATIVPEVDRTRVVTYAMFVFLRCPELSINIDNFKLIVHVYCLLEINAFGISDKTLLRAGTGLYWPTNLINHSCRPNCVAIFSGRRQFIVPCRAIAAGDELTISYIDQGIEDVPTRKLTLSQEYFFDCLCARCEAQERDYDPRIKFIHQLELTGPLATLNRAALHYEKKGDLQNSLKAVYLLLDQVQKSRNVIDKSIKGQAESEEVKVTQEGEKTAMKVYSKKLQKDLLERAVFMSIKLGDFKQACTYQKLIVDLNESMYERGSHPLQPMQLYSLGKLQAQTAQSMTKPIQTAMAFQMAIENMTKALDTLTKFFGGSSKQRLGEKINQGLLDEVKHNIMANQMMIQQAQKRL